MLHLLMAGCWLIFGGVLLAWQWSDPDVPATYIWGTGIPLGWFGIVMALYNFVRWWMGYTYRKTQPAPTADPNFNFTAEPPPPR